MEITTQQKTLFEVYENLSLEEKIIVQCASILYQDFGITRITKFVSGFRLLNEHRKSINTGATLRPYLSLLCRLNLLEDNDGRWKCNSEVRDEILIDAVRQSYYSTFKEALSKRFPFDRWAGYNELVENTYSHLLLAIAKGDRRLYNELVDIIYRRSYLMSDNSRQLFAYNNLNLAIKSNAFEKLGTKLVDFMLVPCLNSAILNCQSTKEILDICSELDMEVGSDIHRLVIIGHVLNGDLDTVRKILSKMKSSLLLVEYEALHSALIGDYDKALMQYEQALKNLRKVTRKRAYYFHGFPGLYHIILMLAKQDPTVYKTISLHLKKEILSLWEDSKKSLSIYFRALQAPGTGDHYYDVNNISDEYYDQMFWYMTKYWLYDKVDRKDKGLLEALCSTTRKIGYKLYEIEFLNIAVTRFQLMEYEDRLEGLKKITGIQPISGIMQPEPEWQKRLKLFSSLSFVNGGEQVNNISEERLVWLIHMEEQNIQPKLQKRTKSGSWTGGRNVALTRLINEGGDYMTQQDHDVSKCIEITNYGYYGGTDTFINFDKAIGKLVGHKNLYLLESPSTPLELAREEVDLLIEPVKDGYSVRFSHDFYDDGVSIIKESPTRYKLLNIKPEVKELSTIIGKKPFTVPEHAKDDLLDAVSKIGGKVTVQSPLTETNADIESIDADSKIYIHLLPVGDGFKAELFVKPFSNHLPYFKPGVGGKSILGQIEGKKVQAIRDTEKEKMAAMSVLQKCPALNITGDYDDPVYFDEPESCLDVLMQIDRMGDEVMLEWPEGEKLKIKQEVSFDNLSIRIKKENDWFGLSGEIKLNNNEVMDIKQLLSLMDQSTSNFVKLENGQFLALTKHFRRQLDNMRAYSEETSNGLKIHPLASMAIDGLTDEIEDLKVDKAWKDMKKRIGESDKKRFRIPSTLQAELRPYQEEGFKWLSRLSHWGVGACLADDMGLGKTIQALTLMLTKLKKGPALVVAPTSVCRNWNSETQKFAPTLNPTVFGNGDRQKQIESLGSMDVLIVSYGLLQNEIKRLSSIEWEMIVLDEAHAIKNADTKRSKAVMSLQANFKLIATGTPLQNHLGELWNLFHFINPGLLGTQKQFNDKYAGPIENGNEERKKQLKNLIKPFILRRTKTAVLDDLPEKTEITMSVELSSDEMSFYEALRQKAVDELEGAEEANAGEKHLKVLAQITKLRQACCHPKLALKSSLLPGSKLLQFEEITDSLIQNNHKALVFSQFVGHLEILEESLKKRGIAYQYLDGSTSQKEREKRIKDFQNGEGEFFLISLKAGGVGLNLTAADYVIHMDPWWNPAIEDQASDRAHRIGQQRPVTVYRLVAKNTIEEKIVMLHKNKRDLADSLLEGTASSSKMSADDLLNLIREA